MVEVEDRICCLCGEPFTCAKTSLRKRCPKEHIGHCEVCGTPCPLKYPKRYCSVRCGSIGAKRVEERKFDCVCQLCGEQFKGIRPTAKYCPNDHYRECATCGKTFKLRSNYSVATTCSKKCAAAIIDFEKRSNDYRATLAERYGEGVVNVSQLDFVKEKKKATLMEHYGVENPSLSPEIVAKRTEILKKVLATGEVQAKTRATNLERYGVECVFQSEGVKEKIRATNLKRYGVDNVFKLESYHRKSVENSRTISKLNRSWKALLEEKFGLPVELEAKIADGMWADLKIGEVYIDLNPTVTHNSTTSFVHITKRCPNEDCTDPKHGPIDKAAHHKRALAARKEGKIFLQKFDWMNDEIFLSIIQSKLKLDEVKIGARECKLKEISQSEANRFLKVNHLLGGSSGQTACFGLYYRGELVFVSTFGKARFNKKFEWEAIRSCSKMGVFVAGGLTRCDSRFKKLHHPESIVSYVDLALSTTQIAEEMNPGWELKSVNRGTSTWVNMSAKVPFVKSSSARALSADRLLGMEIGSKYPLTMSNEEVLKAEGYLEVFGAGSLTFGWA